MAKEKEEPIVDVEEALSKTEQYIENNQKSLSIIIGAILLIVGGYFGWTKWYVAGEEESAQAEMFKAESYFEKDSIQLAIAGDGQHAGFEEIAEDYSVSPSGKLAGYYLGISLLKQGNYEEAIEHLSNFNADDQMVAPIAKGAIGDAYMELGQAEEAISYYLKASELGGNNFVSPIYLKKAAIAYESLGNYNDAIKLYERIKRNYAESDEGRDIEKYIARAEAKSGK